MKKCKAGCAGILALMIVLNGAAVDAAAITMSLIRVKGQVEFKAAGTEQWGTAHERMPIRVGDALKTGRNASAIVRISKDNYTMLGPSSVVIIAGAAIRPASTDASGMAALKNEKQDVTMFQVSGRVSHSLKGMHNGSQIRMVTPVAVAGVRGTDYVSSFVDPGLGSGDPSAFVTNTTFGSNEQRVDVDFQFFVSDGLADNAVFVCPTSGEAPSSQNLAYQGREGASAAFAVFDGSVDVAAISGAKQGPVQQINPGQAVTFAGPAAGAAPGVTDAPVAVPRAPDPGEIDLINDIQVVVVQMVSAGSEEGKTDATANITSIQPEDAAAKDLLAGATIGNFNSLSSSLGSFFLGSITHDNLDSTHPINGGSISWRNFTNSEILEFKQTLSN